MTQPDPTDLPTIPVVEVTADVDFHSTDQNATTAQSMVAGQLGMVNGLAAMGQSFTAPLANANWHGAGGDCYDWSYGSTGCMYQYEVCKVSQAYEWSLTFNGTCWGDIPLVDWVAFAGTTNADGTTGTWPFYEGDIALQNLSSTLEWVKQTDGSEDTTWSMPEATSAWQQTWEIAWNADGTGYWVYYDEDGNEYDRTEWI